MLKEARLQPLVHGARKDFASFLGASLLSATGSLTTHLVPLIVAAVVADGRASVVEAGWMASARAVGELLAAMLLPVLGVVHLGRASVVGGSLLLVIALIVATSHDLPIIMASFFLVGACSGQLKFIGTISASTYGNRNFAFLFRLALILFIAGLAICLVMKMKAFASYDAFLRQIAIIAIPLLLCGGILYMPAPPRSAAGKRETRARRDGLSGLFAIYLFFVGVSGFMTYVGQQALSRGFTLAELGLAFGVMKIGAGLWLFATAYLRRRDTRTDVNGLEVALLFASMWLASLSTSFVFFIAALFVLEVSLNGLSARLQSAAVEASPVFSAKWLNGSILLGLATGPLLQGVAISAGDHIAFLLVSSALMCGPSLWLYRNARRRRP